MAIVHVNACDFYYELHGSGRPIVFVHGEDQNLDYWEYQIAEFSRSHRCLVYDRRGHGRTQTIPFGYSMENQTLDLVQMLDALQLEKPIVVACAMGAAIATNLAISYPDRLSALVLEFWDTIEGYAVRHSYAPFLKQSLRTLDILMTGGQQAFAAFLHSADAEKLFPFMPSDPVIKKKFVDMWSSRSVEGCLKRMEFFTSVPNLTWSSYRIAVPVLGICAEHEAKPEKIALMKDVKNFRWHGVPGARHFVHWEQPEEFNRLVRDFISEPTSA